MRYINVSYIICNSFCSAREDILCFNISRYVLLCQQNSLTILEDNVSNNNNTLHLSNVIKMSDNGIFCLEIVAISEAVVRRDKIWIAVNHGDGFTTVKAQG